MAQVAGEKAKRVSVGQAGLLNELVGDGIVVPVPRRFVVVGRKYEAAAFIALVPLTLGATDGSFRPVQVGDLLTAAEVECSAGALAAMVAHSQVAELDATRGVPALLTALLARVDTLEAAARYASLSDDEIIAVARERGLVKERA